jgi:ribosome-binding factor A
MPREFSRTDRVRHELLRTLSELIRRDVKDPRVAGVSLTEVELSRDMSVARVHFSTLDPDQDPEPALEALQHAAGFLRGRLGRILRLRRVPELRFAHDERIRRGSDVSRLIDEARRRDAD